MSDADSPENHQQYNNQPIDYAQSTFEYHEYYACQYCM